VRSGERGRRELRDVSWSVSPLQSPGDYEGKMKEIDARRKAHDELSNISIRALDDAHAELAALKMEAQSGREREAGVEH
jgi:hypothetical protein